MLYYLCKIESSNRLGWGSLPQSDCPLGVRTVIRDGEGCSTWASGQTRESPLEQSGIFGKVVSFQVKFQLKWTGYSTGSVRKPVLLLPTAVDPYALWGEAGDNPCCGCSLQRVRIPPHSAVAPPELLDSAETASKGWGRDLGVLMCSQ